MMSLPLILSGLLYPLMKAQIGLCDLSLTESIVTSDDYEDDDKFGESVSVSGNTAIIGAYGDDSETGSAYFFVKVEDGNWNQTQKVSPSDLGFDDDFGYSVSIDEDHAIVGAPEDDDNSQAGSGSAYIYERSSGVWTQKAKLTASDPSAADGFGYSVAICGDYAIVGANRYNEELISDVGAIYIFQRSSSGTWSQSQKFIASDYDSSDQFGYSVAMSGSYAAVGAPFFNGAQGKVYIFERDSDGSYSEKYEITASSAIANSGDNFGTSVALSGTVLIVGADGWGAAQKGSNFEDSGAGYIFTFDGSSWSQKNFYTGSYLSNLGKSVAASNDYVIVGQPTGVGEVWVIQKDESDGTFPTFESQTEKLEPESGTQLEYGYRVDISGSTILIGTQAGMAYFYDGLQFSTTPAPGDDDDNSGNSGNNDDDSNSDGDGDGDDDDDAAISNVQLATNSLVFVFLFKLFVL